MFDFIIEVIAYVFVEIIFEGILKRIAKGVKWVGIVVLRLMTLNQRSIKEIKDDYKDSSKPYFIGIGILVGLIYTTIKLMN